MKNKKIIITALMAASLLLLPGNSVQAAGAGEFDPVFYMNTYPDVAYTCGNNDYALLMHYLNVGMAEGRVPYEGAAPGTPVEDPADKIESAVKSGKIVPFEKLAHYSSLKRKQTDAQFRQAYDEALTVVGPLADLPLEDQLVGIAQNLRYRFERAGNYSTEQAHYDDPYGYLILNTASCAGCARATGLCLDMLGIPYEHVNESKWTHQWCRVPVGDTYWICDAFMAYAGPEPAPYVHPDGYSKEGVPVPENLQQGSGGMSAGFDMADLMAQMEYEYEDMMARDYIRQMIELDRTIIQADGTPVNTKEVAETIAAQYEGQHMTRADFDREFAKYMNNLTPCPMNEQLQAELSKRNM